MKKKLEAYGQYKKDIFEKLGVEFKKGAKILDLGCGDGVDSLILKNVFGLNAYACDIYQDNNFKIIKGVIFRKGGIFNIPYENNFFDYVFLHDVLHHVDEHKQRYEKHLKGLSELKRVIKKDGMIIIIEGNRYNPLFYPHMVKFRGHEHFRQDYFKKIILDVFPKAKFKFFEAHLYPQSFLAVFKVYEKIMEKIAPSPIKAYNVAIIKM